MNRKTYERLMIPVMSVLTITCHSTVSAAILEVSGITTTPATTPATETSDPVVLNAVTVGPTTYNVIELPTSVVLDSDAVRFQAINGTDAGSDAATLTDANLDTGVLNPGGGLVQWGRTIALDEVIVYMDLDRTRFDGIVIRAIDENNNVIGDFQRTISDDLTPTILYEQNFTREDGPDVSNDSGNIGYTFTLGDLIGTTGDLSLATGIRFEDASTGNSGNTDPTLIAIIAIPEPATMILLALGGLMMSRRRRVSA